ncbi:MAG: hypothetical protein KBB95_18575 [Deltaproteobacteria bacterium]|nr:hypothetical protein [Deltaproteobacteria bacterium]
MRVPEGELSAVAVALGAAYERISDVREVDNQMRIEFVRALGSLRGNVATPALVRIMGVHSESQHFLINRLAARELGQNGDPAAVEPMIRALFQFAPRNPRMRMNDVAAEALVRIGRPSLQPLLSVLDGTHSAANIAADALIAAFREGDPNLSVSREQVVTPEATYALGMLGLADAFEPLFAETRARERSRQLNGLVALVRLRLTAAQQRRVRVAVTAIYRRLGADQIETRAQLLATMANTFDPAYLPLFFTVARDQRAHTATRETALVSLARLANRAQAAQLRSIIAADADNAARYDEYLVPYLLAAEQCDTDLACYVAELVDPDAMVAEKAAWMLGLLAPDDHPAALEGLTQQLGHPAFDARFAALQALDHIAASGSQAAIDRIDELRAMEEGRAIWDRFKGLALPIQARLRVRMQGAGWVAVAAGSAAK